MGNIRERAGIPWDPPESCLFLPNLKIPVFGARKAERVLLTSALRIFTPALRRSIASIAVLERGQRGHFGYLDKEKTRRIVAHCHPDGHICIRPNCQTITNIAHEAAHALTFHLRGTLPNDDFERAWTEAAGGMYRSLGFSKGQAFPCDGLLDAYGGTSFLEDVATYVGHLYAAAFGLAHPLYGAAKTDSRYHKKLELLLQYEFISQEDLDFAQPFFR